MKPLTKEHHKYLDIIIDEYRKLDRNAPLIIVGSPSPVTVEIFLQLLDAIRYSGAYTNIESDMLNGIYPNLPHQIRHRVYKKLT